MDHRFDSTDLAGTKCEEKNPSDVNDTAYL